MRWMVFAAALAGCTSGEGEWVVETWGEDFIERQIPADVFADGCSVTYDEFLVGFERLALLDGDGGTVAEVPAGVNDLAVPGPTLLGRLPVPADHYSTVQLQVAPDPELAAGTATADQVAALHDAGASVLVDGVLTCDGASAHFRWPFQADTTYDCEPTDLTVPAGGADTTQLTIHGDHLFYDGLVNADAEVRGRELLAADADEDGELTVTELRAVSIPELGFEVGPYGQVLDLYDFVEHLSRTLGHVDGEGECRVDL